MFQHNFTTFTFIPLPDSIATLILFLVIYLFGYNLDSEEFDCRNITINFAVQRYISSSKRFQWENYNDNDEDDKNAKDKEKQ